MILLFMRNLPSGAVLSDSSISKASEIFIELEVSISNQKIDELYKKYIENNDNINFTIDYGNCHIDEYVKDGRCRTCPSEYFAEKKVLLIIFSMVIQSVIQLIITGIIMV